MRSFPNHFAAFGLCAALSVGTGCAAVITITNPTRVTGTDAIDPTGAHEISSAANVASGATAQSILEATTGFGAIQSFGGFSGNSTKNNEYVFNNTTDATLPDLRIVYTGDISSGVVAVFNDSFSTSSSSSMRLPGSGTGTYGMSIQLGEWNGTTLATGNDLGVSTFGFTLSGRYGQVNGVNAIYYDAAGNVLSTQNLGNPGVTGTGTGAVYSGYQITSGQNAISRVEISVSPISETSNGLFALDDVGFTPMVPEPSSLLMAFGALPLLWSRRKRRE